jgi:hypothetical protein
MVPMHVVIGFFNNFFFLLLLCIASNVNKGSVKLPIKSIYFSWLTVGIEVHTNAVICNIRS